ncbi:hypothetical protein ABPG72_018818 [Tetrahymena utriculariae]
MEVQNFRVQKYLPFYLSDETKWGRNQNESKSSKGIEENILKVIQDFEWYQNDNERVIKRKQCSTLYARYTSISKQGKLDIFIHDKSVNSQQYIKCLNQCYFLFQKTYFKENDCIFFQGAPSCRSVETKNFLETKNLKYINNSQWRPDINPIEFIWAQIKWVFKKISISNQITSSQELEDTHCNDNLHQIIDEEGDYII